MYQFSLLKQTQAYCFEKFTYPTYRPLLKTLNSNQAIVAIGVALESQPVGLGLAAFDENKAEILSLFIHPEHRKKGLGKNLLSNLEMELKQRGCSEVRVVFVANATTPSFERILGQLNWTTPQLRMLVCEGTRDSFQNSPLLKLNLTLPSSYAIFPWVELTHEDKQVIQKQQSLSAWYPEVLSPFDEEEIIEPINSLGLRYQGQVVGWMITHRVAIDTLRYTKLFVKKELQSIGRAIPLLVKAIQIQLESTEAHKAVFTVIADNYMMIDFVNRRLAPYLNSLRYSWQALTLI